MENGSYAMVIAQAGFTQPYTVEGRSSIADLFKPNNRCGLYILYFANGDLYAGQAVDVTRRYVQHCKVHSDIQGLSFRKVAQRNLDQEEQALIPSLERAGHSLRNFTFTSVPKGESDFDLIMSLEEQERWISDLSYIDYGGSRVNDPVLRHKYTEKFRRFASMPSSNEVVEILRLYVRTGLPVIRRSELSFWCCSCLPGNSQGGIRIYTRINVYWQEVLTIYENERELCLSLHLARSPIESAFGSSTGPLVEMYPTLRVTGHQYKPGGYDQLHLEIRGAGATLKLLKDPVFLQAIRLFNLRLMKKGACNFGRYHCLDLADLLTSDASDNTFEGIDRGS